MTYIRPQEEFVFLAVILDAFSRHVIGWALEGTLKVELTSAALRMALSRRLVAVRPVRHSDRGKQYASHIHTNLLESHSIAISMSRKGNPWENGAWEAVK